MFDLIKKNEFDDDCLIQQTERMRALNFMYSEKNTDIWDEVRGLNFKALLTDPETKLDSKAFASVLAEQFSNQTNIELVSIKVAKVKDKAIIDIICNDTELTIVEDIS